MKIHKANKKTSLKYKVQAYLLIVGVILAGVVIANWNLIAPAKSNVSKLLQEENQIESLDPSLVCMVNDTYMGKPQIPVPVNGKTYYGCCQGCVDKLNNEQTARMSKDPFSGKQIDKSQAFIVLMNQQGKVSYFESKDNYIAYTKK